MFQKITGQIEKFEAGGMNYCYDGAMAVSHCID